MELVLSRAGDVKSWITDVEAFFTNRAITENIIPKGYKLVTGKGNRKISDPELAVVVLKEHGFKEEDLYAPKTLKSIVQLEKLGNKGQVASTLGGLILRPETAPKLVKDTTVLEDFA
jgi:hypothetical protein